MSLHMCIGCFKEISSDCDMCPHCAIQYPFERGMYKCLECKKDFIHPTKKETCNQCGSKSYSFVPVIDSKLWDKYISKDDIYDAVYKDNICYDVKVASKIKYKKILKILYPLVFVLLFVLFWMTRNDTTDNSLGLIGLIGLATLFVTIMVVGTGLTEWFLYKFIIYKEVLHDQMGLKQELDLPKLEILSDEVGAYNKYLIRGHILNRIQKRLIKFSEDESFRTRIISYRYYGDSGYSKDYAIVDITKDNRFYVPSQEVVQESK